VEVGLLRAALYKAARDAGPDGLSDTDMPQRVYQAMGLPRERFMREPNVRFLAETQALAAMRAVLAYRVYHDLRRGWRITSPNLEQCGLLEIRYEALEDVCRADDVWAACHPALAGAPPETRVQVAKALLDYMRRELAIYVDALSAEPQERLRHQSNQHLVPPWAIDEDEGLEQAAVLYPRPARPHDSRVAIYLSARGGFGQYLRRGVFPHHPRRLTLDDTQAICRQLLTGLKAAGLVTVVDEGDGPDPVPGYQLKASALRWVAGDGTRAFHDPIRVPNQPAEGCRTNPFFVEFHRTMAASLAGLEAREHTAQVPSNDRIERENRFRRGDLPVLYCSPTQVHLPPGAGTSQGRATGGHPLGRTIQARPVQHGDGFRAIPNT
jgi:hypothetical protein